jgi:ketosteroid isomerase-like protein
MARQEEAGMGAEENRNTARMAVESFQSGDLETLLGLFSDEAVWRAPGRGPLSGTYRKQNLKDFFGKLLALSGGTARPEIVEILTSDERIVWFLGFTAQRNGKNLDVLLAQPCRVDGEGKIAETWFLPSDQQAWDLFWS